MKAALAFFGFAVLLYCSWVICTFISMGATLIVFQDWYWKRAKEIHIYFSVPIVLCLVVGVWLIVGDARSRGQN